MSTVEIVSKENIKMIQRESLDGIRNLVSNTKTITLDNEWYNLKIPYIDNPIDIQDIKIDGESLKEVMYTGYVKTKNNKIYFNPYLNEEGVYSIWIHGNLGTLMERTMTSVDNGDYGQNLFEKYMLTVERDLSRKGKSFTPSIDGYLKTARGPFWWKKGTDTFPYQVLDTKIDNKKEILEELKVMKPFKFFEKHSNTYTLSYKNEGYPLVDVEDIEYPLTREMFKKLGYKKILNFAVNRLEPNSDIYIHRDVGFEDEEGFKDHIKGCKQLYVLLDGDPQDNVFKLGCAGRVPVDKPVIVNNSLHAHCVVNYNDKPRTTLLAYGIRI